jgi:hypothetical protein
MIKRFKNLLNINNGIGSNSFINYKELVDSVINSYIQEK